MMYTMCVVLTERVALVTGSTSGIGLSIAESLAQRGCQIILNGFGDEKLIQSLQNDFQTSACHLCVVLCAFGV